MSGHLSANEVATEIKKLDWDEPEKYRVEWRSGEAWNPSAVYTVTEIRFGEGGRPMVKIEGPDGGEYLIDSNPAGKPEVAYLRPDGYTSSDRLAELKIYEEQVHWRNRLLRYMPGVSEADESTT